MGWFDEQVDNGKKYVQNAYDNVTGKNGTTSQIGGLNGMFAGGAVAGIPGYVIGGKSGGDLATGISNTLLGPPPTAPTAPGQDPTLAGIKAQQVQDANDYRTNLPKTQQDLYEGARNSERKNLATNIVGVRNNANSRGLLYSGMEQGNELGARANSNANLAQTRTEINNSTENTARQMEANAVQSGIQQQQSMASIQDQTMSQALANMAARRQGISGIAQGAGSVAGMYAANRNNGTSYGVSQPTVYGT